MENRCCDVCGAPIRPGVVCIVRWGYLYCPDCEVIHRRNEEEQIRRNKNKGRVQYPPFEG